MAEDYYKTLGVSRDASSAEIQKAYRELARKYHPDLHPDDKDAKKKFQEVQAAFDVLNDQAKREQYDRYGSSFESAGAGGGPRATWSWTGQPGAGPGRGGPAGAEDFDFSQIFGGGGEAPGGFGDIFSQFRQARGGKKRGAAAAAKRGADLATETEIPFVTAILGGEVQLSIHRESGEIETIVVKIPIGIEDGKKIRLRGQGEPAPGRGGTPGDILITVRVGTHPFFSRRGNNLDVKVPVTLAEAVLGAKIDIPTPKGTIVLRVPPGTSSGKKLRVKGLGVAPKGSDPGDLFAEILIVLPHAIDDEARGLIRKFDEQTGQAGQNPRSDLDW
ncbi:MAG TPA: J domain-containing protein [Pirellulales bacterium]|nr:J domain-containing protein [Pirellulales bacterium]